jgi:hypothetical protein
MNGKSTDLGVENEHSSIPDDRQHKPSQVLIPQWPTIINTTEIVACRRDLLLATDRYSSLRMRCGTLDLTDSFLLKTPALSVIPLPKTAPVKEIPSHVSPSLLDPNTM